MQNFPLNLLTLPYWWYTAGARIVFGWNRRIFHYSLQKSGLVMLARHLNEPLYKDYTKSGIIISFFIRIILIAAKSLIMLVRLAGLAVFDLFYLLLLPAIIIMIIWQMMPA